MEINKRMFEKMKMRCIEQKTLANYLGVPQQTVHNWSSRGSDPPAKYICGICELLEVSIEWLLTGKEGKHSDLTEDEKFILLCFEELEDKIEREYIKGELVRAVREQRLKKSNETASEMAI